VTECTLSEPWLAGLLGSKGTARRAPEGGGKVPRGGSTATLCDPDSGGTLQILRFYGHPRRAHDARVRTVKTQQLHEDLQLASRPPW